MANLENYRLAYRDKFRSLHNEAFQSWFEILARLLHGPGNFQSVRKARGDGGLDGFVINSKLVYQVYAPSRVKEMRDSETASKIRTDFSKAFRTLKGSLEEWVFVHNHPEGKIGKLSANAVANLKLRHPTIRLRVLDIDSLWEEMKTLDDTALGDLFGVADESKAGQMVKAAPLQLDGWYEHPSVAESRAYLLAKVTTLQSVLIVGLDRELSDREMLLWAVVGGFKQLIALGKAATLPEPCLTPLKRARQSSSSAFLMDLYSEFMIRAINYFEHEAPPSVAISYFIGVLCHLVADKTESPELLDTVRECRSSIAKIFARDHNLELPPVLVTVLSSALDRTASSLPGDVANLVAWATAKLGRR